MSNRTSGAAPKRGERRNPNPSHRWAFAHGDSSHDGAQWHRLSWEVPVTARPRDRFEDLEAPTPDMEPEFLARLGYAR